MIVKTYLPGEVINQQSETRGYIYQSWTASRIRYLYQSRPISMQVQVSFTRALGITGVPLLPSMISAGLDWRRGEMSRLGVYDRVFQLPDSIEKRWCLNLASYASATSVSCLPLAGERTCMG